jgi:hypothetical protein
MSWSVFCIATSDLQAAQLVTALRDAGFSERDVSVLCADQAAQRPAGLGRGGGVGGVLAWLAGTGMIAVPGIGAVIAAGPILGAIGDAAGGATGGGLLALLVRLGMPEREARRYEGRIRTGAVLLSVHTETPDERARVAEVFARAGAEDVSSDEDAPPAHA